jgi:hypothetical protein
MLIISVCLIGLEYLFHINPAVIHAAETIDLFIIGGYYVFFFMGFRVADKKIQYCKSHVFLIILLIIPFLPFARALRLQFLEKFFKLGSNVAWHILDEIGML